MDFSQGLLDMTKAPHNCIFKRSCLQMFYKGTSSEKFWKIHRKTPVLELFSNQVAGLQRATLFISKETSLEKFTCEFCENFINPFFI